MGKHARVSRLETLNLHCLRNRYAADYGNHNLAAFEVWLRTQAFDFETGITYLKSAANRGCASACLTLGKLLHDGTRIERNIPEALCLFEKAAEGGSAAGWNSLGVCHEELGAFVDAQRCYRSCHVASVNPCTFTRCSAQKCLISNS